jgi:L-amino acid N-acyltransferase YncA
MIRPAENRDAEALSQLYNYFVVHTVTTFETDPIDGEEMAKRVADVKGSGLPWLVLEQDKAIIGYACAVRWKGRAAYQHSVESTIYLAQGCAGRGLGTALYNELIAQLSTLGVHCVLAGIAQPNEQSVALHEKLGFNKVAHFAEVGRKFDGWVDVGYWQRLLS